MQKVSETLLLYISVRIIVVGAQLQFLRPICLATISFSNSDFQY